MSDTETSSDYSSEEEEEEEELDEEEEQPIVLLPSGREVYPYDCPVWADTSKKCSICRMEGTESLPLRCFCSQCGEVAHTPCMRESVEEDNELYELDQGPPPRCPSCKNPLFPPQ